MSAWLVGKPHIDAMIWAFLEYAPGEIDTSQFAGRDQLGQLLMDECQKSIDYLYPGCSPSDKPGWAEDYLTPYEYTRPNPPPTLVETHKNLKCYEYQSCEHPEWPSSDARLLTQMLLLDVIGLLQSSDDEIKNSQEWHHAPWGWGEPQ